MYLQVWAVPPTFTQILSLVPSYVTAPTICSVGSVRVVRGTPAILLTVPAKLLTCVSVLKCLLAILFLLLKMGAIQEPTSTLRAPTLAIAQYYLARVRSAITL